ncbi:hypothetical protein [Flavivirga eckloniae]|uniref:Peptidase S1 domain-containing protein n=1 Tax=Flavivirga eckloniae TaxID=1803846 RepID=A0A2K9PNF5_9FLAO|nr:hypothetical protein [Flavivirga eckloniae]AUP78600.1 hypothetical protein C1H87_07695 [Flavivirga eckloniae]
MKLDDYPWIKRHFAERKLIASKEGKISLFQFIGFALIVIGVIYILFKIFSASADATSAISGERIAIAFFIVMLGVSFAFPSLLQDQNKGLSTMRIVVFMITNVICLLLLKIGWNVTSLTELGVDQYWVGIIAFVFGAKATQAYFESKMAVPKEAPQKVGIAALTYSQADIAKLALEQNQNILMHKFPNIESISDAVHDMNQERTHVISIYLKDNNTSGIPEMLEVNMPDGTRKTISTEIIEDVGEGGIQCSQYDDYKTENITGSVCCMAETSNQEKVLVTSGHIYTGLRLLNHGGWLSNAQAKWVELNGEKTIGKWIFQQITYVQDIGLIELNDTNANHDLITFGSNGFYNISDISIKKEEVTLISSKSGRRDGYLLDHNTTWVVAYSNEKQYKGNIILVGSTPHRNNSKTLSQGGDSGGLVFHKNSQKLIGMILGGNNKFTWVLPLKDTFNYFELTLI